ncbi:uncharacterized protein LOC106051838 isoform X2 [Biomphalaria glabrata]|uniref:Uncharacterized protein LOC106051838 isoform X2 n=1 Tax=Biomphalaria glabrata TaxID=6526 RepID=A0A9W2Y9T7_BIOGL|nr:uncharacterized protein LOC106051838 isoform X2 [Biomphalaria glabrata]
MDIVVPMKLHCLFTMLFFWDVSLLPFAQTSSLHANTDCGGEFTTEAGTFKSPNFPQGYPTNTICEWTIKVPEHQVIALRFHSFNVDFSDFVAFYDGDSRYDPVIGSTVYRGYWSQAQVSNFSIRSTGHKLHVALHAQGWPSGQGFSASYWSQECQPFTYGRGKECNQSCSCIRDNTLYCDSTTGRCVCKEGWTSATCAVDINECSNPNVCDDVYSTCRNVNGSYECECKPGLARDSTGRCQDSNRCTHKNCSHACGVLSEGPKVETCYCPKGMRLAPNNDQVCVECSLWSYGENCTYVANCHRDNTKYYDKLTGHCICYPNWTSPDCSEDVNECLLEVSPCSGLGQACFNTHGSFQCHCLQSYEVYNQTHCIACGQILTSPSGNISSPAYYVYSGLRNRTECFWTISVSEKHVVALSFLRFGLSIAGHFGSVALYDGSNSSAPLIGTYSSSSPGLIISSYNSMHIVRYGSSSYSHGYTTNGFDATYISYECPEFHYGPYCNLMCHCVRSNSMSCDNHHGTCSCLPGWTGPDCSLDRDECSEKRATCPEYSDCRNKKGGYECVCKAGLEMNNQNICTPNVVSRCQQKQCSDMCVVIPTTNNMLNETCYCPVGMMVIGEKCIACQNWTYGPECHSQCQCSHTTTVACHAVSGHCQCMPGWTGLDCSTDVNECDSSDACPLYSTCINLPGSYNCSCQKKNGFVNNGPYSCVQKACEFKLNGSSGYITSPWYPYQYYNNANCTWTVTVQKGHVISLLIEDFELESHNWCANDYITVYDGSTTQSSIVGKYCSERDIPSLIRSSSSELLVEFKSDAHNNFRGFNISYSSHLCENFTYGDKCSSACQCVQSNSWFCDNLNGHCICKSGWQGNKCQEDVDECLAAQVCQPNSECVNTLGSYNCMCRVGFYLNITSGLCVERGECKVKHCSHTCWTQGEQETCGCPDHLELTSDGFTCVVPYYSYGFSNGDGILSSDNMLVSLNNNTVYVSKPIYLNQGVPFGSSEQLQTVAYVMTSGAIILGATGFSDIPSSPNLHQAFTQNQFMIAPYWANINPTEGYTTHHLYENCILSQPDHGSAQKEIIMKRAARDISEYHNLKGFQVSTVLVVTWVSREPLHSDNEVSDRGSNTFQSLLISGWAKEIHDGHEVLAEEETSYVIFIYQKGQMNWNFIPDRIINIGVISDTITQLPTTDHDLVGMIDSVQGNTGYLGVFSFKVGTSHGPATQCNRYICSKLPLLSDPVYANEMQQLYKCPCTIAELGHQWQLFEKRGLNQNIYCYAISTVAKARFLHNNRRNKLCCYKWDKPEGNDWQEWEESRMKAAYIPSDSPLSGHLLISDPWSWSYFNNSEALENIAAHHMCCKQVKSEKCDLFYKIFPDTGCTDFVDFVPASALGDPHIITLDGLLYTMNGWGEYTMMDVSEENFTLQARTEPIAPLYKATVFTAFSAKENNDAHVQVELSPNKKGVSMKVYVALNNLEIELYVDKHLLNKTFGLVGNFNGNKRDEFTLPDGTVLPGNLSHYDIFYEFAKKWEVTPATSVFLYKSDQNYLHYWHPDYVPMFENNLDRHQHTNAVRLCGSSSHACIFDYLTTLDAKFAENSKKAILRYTMLSAYLAHSHETSLSSKDSETLDCKLFRMRNNGTLQVQEIDSKTHIDLDRVPAGACSTPEMTLEKALCTAIITNTTMKNAGVQ